MKWKNAVITNIGEYNPQLIEVSSKLVRGSIVYIKWKHIAEPHEANAYPKACQRPYNGVAFMNTITFN